MCVVLNIYNRSELMFLLSRLDRIHLRRYREYSDKEILRLQFIVTSRHHMVPRWLTMLLIRLQTRRCAAEFTILYG